MIRNLSLTLMYLAIHFVAAAQDPKKTAAVLTGDSKGSAANNPQCKLFTTAEASKYIGEPVGEIANAGMGMGCQWLAKDGEGDMMVTVVPARYHEDRRNARNYRKLEVGGRGFVAQELDGWVAGTIMGEDSIIVSVAGKAANAKMAEDLLNETLKRRKK